MELQSRVVAIELLSEVSLFTDSTSTDKTMDLEVPELEGLLPHAESLSLEWLLRDCLPNEIQWNILAYVGWDRENELPSPVAFFSTVQSATGPQLAALTNVSTSNYRRHMRLVLQWRLVSGVSVPKQGTLSAILYVTTKGT